MRKKFLFQSLSEKGQWGIEKDLSLRADGRPREAPDASLRQAEARALLEKAMSRLDGRARSVLVLKEIEGLPTEAVAEVLGITPATVRVHLFKARAKLRKYLEEAGYRHGPSVEKNGDDDNDEMKEN